MSKRSDPNSEFDSKQCSDVADEGQGNHRIRGSLLPQPLQAEDSTVGDVLALLQTPIDGRPEFAQRRLLTAVAQHFRQPGDQHPEGQLQESRHPEDLAEGLEQLYLVAKALHRMDGGVLEAALAGTVDHLAVGAVNAGEGNELGDPAVVAHPAVATGHHGHRLGLEDQGVFGQRPGGVQRG